MENNIKIKELLYNKHNITERISNLIHGSIEIRDNKYIYVHYRDDGRLLTKFVGDYTEELYNLILNNNIEFKQLKKELKKINKELKDLNYVETELSEKVKLNIDYAKSNIVNTIYSQAILEGITTTYADTEKIIEGGKISEMTSDDVMKVVNLKHAWQFILSENVILSENNFDLLCEINKLILEGFYYTAGKIRTTPVKIGGTDWTPKLPIESIIKEDLEQIYNSKKSQVDKSIELLLYVMKSQIFINGNKRTAVIFANHYLIKNGLGLIIIKEDNVDEFKALLLNYYTGKDDKTIKNYLKKHCYQNIN